MRRFITPRVPGPPAHPLVRLLYKKMAEEKLGVLDVEERAGLPRGLISHWRARSIPNVANLEACFNVLGYKLVVKRVEPLGRE